MLALWGPRAPAGLNKGSWSLLKPRMTSMLWTCPPTVAPPPLPISWKLLGERQLSSTMLMVSSDKCIRASGRSPGPVDKREEVLVMDYRRSEITRLHLMLLCSVLLIILTRLSLSEVKEVKLESLDCTVYPYIHDLSTVLKMIQYVTIPFTFLWMVRHEITSSLSKKHFFFH